MFDKDTLTALQEANAIAQAKQSLSFADDTKELVALPSDYKLHDLEPYQQLRRRARGTMTTASVPDFSEYTAKHAEPGATVFVDQDKLQATAVLNLGEPTAPGHADNRATLVPVRTAAYASLMLHGTGAGLAQKAVAEWMEDWADNITCFAGEGEIKTAQAVAAVRKITIDAMRKVESTEQALSASKSAFESITASSTETLPNIILFKCQPFADFKERTFALRLGVLTSEATPRVNLRISKFEEHQQDMAIELAALVAAGLAATEIPVLIGSYSKAN